MMAVLQVVGVLFLLVCVVFAFSCFAFMGLYALSKPLGFRNDIDDMGFHMGELDSHLRYLYRNGVLTWEEYLIIRQRETKFQKESWFITMGEMD